jgi:protein TonB
MNPLRLYSYILGISLLSLLPRHGSAQIIDTTIYTVVEHQPEFPGGGIALTEYLRSNVQYPSEAKQASISGRVFVSFVVELDGRITHIQLLKELGFGCDEEAIRVVKTMPRWKPGSQSGRPIRVKYNLPILFGVANPKRRGD